MRLNVTGHHLEITTALRSYVEKKLERITRHFDTVQDAAFILTVEKLEHRAEATLHLRGENLHALAEELEVDLGPPSVEVARAELLSLGAGSVRAQALATDGAPAVVPGGAARGG